MEKIRKKRRLGGRDKIVCWAHLTDVPTLCFHVVNQIIIIGPSVECLLLVHEVNDHNKPRATDCRGSLFISPFHLSFTL